MGIRTSRWIVAALSLHGGFAAAQSVVQTNQTSGTDALLIGVSPVNERIVWVSGTRGTWGRTQDGGATWQIGQVPGADSLQFRDVHAVDVQTAYLLSIGDGAQSRIYKTSNGGLTWVLQFTNSEPKGFYDCFDFWTPERGVVIGDAVDGKIAVLTTSNGGTTWERIAPDQLPVANPGEGSFAASGRCLSTGPGGRAWIVMSNPTEARLLSTADYGRSWSIAVLPIPTREAVGPASVSFRDPLHGAILGSSADSTRAVIVTQDGGKTWIPRGPVPLPRGVYGGGYVPGGRLAVLVAVGPDGIAVSPDEGNSWSLISKENHWSVAMASPRAGWAVGTRGRITRLSLRETPNVPRP
jgi:photosystem II stability/assembly factor-like uncharacterized protein